MKITEQELKAILSIWRKRCEQLLSASQREKKYSKKAGKALYLWHEMYWRKVGLMNAINKLHYDEVKSTIPHG